ncbi:MAG: hypothetical protein JO235_08335 [Chroococcidiopsidaceae cyanobacterium CP_BM_RX_35]|nr:hypothetical protein [Chroococcidiopsidaceae cyanobacterium CP_BM_RX_35]
MSGRRSNLKQIQIYLKARANGCTQATAAAKGGCSVTTGGRIEKGTHQPQRGQPRHWRSREAPLAEVWESELVPRLEQTPELQPMTWLEYLQAKYPGKYDKSKLRRLEKRVQQGKARSGPPKEVMFDSIFHSRADCSGNKSPRLNECW